MCAIQNLKMSWMNQAKEDPRQCNISNKEINFIHHKYLRLQQNRKDHIMRQKNEFYSTIQE